MNETWDVMLALLTGAVRGTFFFGGLWWTIHRGMTSDRSALWFCGSWLLRTSVTLAGFFLIARGDLVRLLTCLLGFVFARMIVMRLTRDAAKPGDLSSEAIHAS